MAKVGLIVGPAGVKGLSVNNEKIPTTENLTSFDYLHVQKKKKIVVPHNQSGHQFNPLVPSAANMRRNAKILILILEGIIKKISYERRDYESVDEKKTYLSLCPEKLRKKRIQAVKG